MAIGTDRTGTSSLTHFIPPYWDTVLGENLYPNLYFYQFGTKRTVPRNFGTTIKIPRLQKKNIVGEIVAASEGKVIGTCPISDQWISGTMRQYAGAYKHSDVLVMTALSDVIELSLIDIARDIAKKIDTTVRDELSATGYGISGAAGGGVANPDIMRPGHIIEAVVRLDAADNPRPPDNHYPIICHPKNIYDLQANLSGGAWLDINKANSGENAGKLYIGEMGRMYGARFVTSSNIKEQHVVSTGVSGSMSYMFAPDSFYVTEISDMTAKTYVKNLGSAGAADPVNQYATVGAKVYFGVVPAAWTSTEYRLVRIKNELTL